MFNKGYNKGANLVCLTVDAIGSLSKHPITRRV